MARLQSRLTRGALVVILWFVAVNVGWSDITYRVKRHDTLSSISRNYGISVSKLAAYNSLSSKNKIYVGQRLLIPSKTGSSSTPSRAPSVDLPKELSRVRASSRWKYIVVHHSGSSAGDVKGIDRYHREERHMENGMAYHFLIGNGRRMKDGEIAVGNRWLKQLDGGHLASLAQNKVSIGICLVGNFDRQRPTRKQMESLQALTLYLMRQCHISSQSVKTHQEINVVGTRCPGKFFQSKTFLRDLKGASQGLTALSR